MHKDKGHKEKEEKGVKSEAVKEEEFDGLESTALLLFGFD